MIINTNSESQMIQLGIEIAGKLKGGDIVLLYGELGAGKTTMTKGIASYFGIENVVSPTFTLMNTYEVVPMRIGISPVGSKSKKHKVKRLVHIDTYRLEDENDLIEIGVEDYLGAPDTICVVEWPEKIEGLLKDKKAIKIKIEHDGDGRLVKIVPPSDGIPSEGGKD